MNLDVSSLNKALLQLQKSLKYAALATEKNDADLFEQMRNSVIQCFEFSYELSHKMLKRQLEAMAASPVEIDQMSFQQLIRSGAEKGLLNNSWDKWKFYRDARNATSHAYDQKKAQAVYEQVPAFYEEALFLLAQLKKHND